jgi:hypothetical protein
MSVVAENRLKEMIERDARGSKKRKRESKQKMRWWGLKTVENLEHEKFDGEDLNSS